MSAHAVPSRFRRRYGAGPAHLLLMAGSLALASYAAWGLGVARLWDAGAWWQSVIVWLLAAVVVHDLVLFPLYAAADRVLTRWLGSRPLPLLNHVRVPLLAIALSFLIFLPGIIEQGADSYRHATGQTQEPFLGRWLWLSAGIVLASATAYLGRVLLHRRRQKGQR